MSQLTDDKGVRKKEILIGQIRDMGADAYVLPNEAAEKVYIIERADTIRAVSLRGEVRRDKSSKIISLYKSLILYNR